MRDSFNSGAEYIAEVERTAAHIAKGDYSNPDATPSQWMLFVMMSMMKLAYEKTGKRLQYTID